MSHFAWPSFFSPSFPTSPPSGPSPQLKLLCGADFLDTFKIPGLWREDHVEEVAGRFGLVCVSRGGLQPERAVHESDTLSRHCRNIFLVREWVRNETSATEVRRALRRGLSVKYLVPDSVIEYIHQHNLYTEDSERRNKDTVLRPLTKQAQQPVKTLDDWWMEGYIIKLKVEALANQCFPLGTERSVTANPEVCTTCKQCTRPFKTCTCWASSLCHSVTEHYFVSLIVLHKCRVGSTEIKVGIFFLVPV